MVDSVIGTSTRIGIFACREARVRGMRQSPLLDAQRSWRALRSGGRTTKLATAPQPGDFGTSRGWGPTELTRRRWPAPMVSERWPGGRLAAHCRLPKAPDLSELDYDPADPACFRR